MKKRIIGCLAFIPVLAMAGENGGVLATNYGAGMGVSISDNSNGASISVGASFPLHDYIGASVGVSGKRQGYDFDLETIGYSLDGSIFLRDFNIGKIGIGASYNNTYYDSDLPISYNNSEFMILDNVYSHSYSLSAEYYLYDFTIGASRSISGAEYGDNYDVSNAFINWYWQDNTRLSASTDGMDSNNRYSVGIAFQPKTMNNSTEIGLTYSNNVINDSVYLTATYHFNTLVSLKDRDRKYR